MPGTDGRMIFWVFYPVPFMYSTMEFDTFPQVPTLAKCEITRHFYARPAHHAKCALAIRRELATDQHAGIN